MQNNKKKKVKYLDVKYKKPTIQPQELLKYTSNFLSKFVDSLYQLHISHTTASKSYIYFAFWPFLFLLKAR